MKKEIDIFRYIAVLFAPLAAMIAVILRAVILLRDFDATTGYYVTGATLPRILTAVLIVFFVLFLAAAFILRGKFTIPHTGGLNVLFSSAFLLITLLVSAVSCLIAMPAGVGYQSFFLFMSAVSALTAVVYLAMIIKGSETESVIRAMLALGGAFYGLFLAVTLYFDSTVSINAPAKIYHLVAYLALAVFFVSECRHMLARTKPALHYLVCSVSLVLTASASLPNILYSLLNGTVLVLDTVSDFLLFAAFLYILARLIQCLPQDDNSASAMVGLIARRTEEAAGERGEAEEETPDDGDDDDDGADTAVPQTDEEDDAE